MPLQAYLIDAFSIYAASAVAAATVLRYLLGTFLPLIGNSLNESLGLGWGNTLLAGVSVALAPIPLIFLRYGEKLRERFSIDM
jgi:hypothetical protein